MRRVRTLRGGVSSMVPNSAVRLETVHNKYFQGYLLGEKEFSEKTGGNPENLPPEVNILRISVGISGKDDRKSWKTATFEIN